MDFTLTASVRAILDTDAYGRAAAAGEKDLRQQLLMITAHAPSAETAVLMCVRCSCK